MGLLVRANVALGNTYVLHYTASGVSIFCFCDLRSCRWFRGANTERADIFFCSEQEFVVVRWWQCDRVSEANPRRISDLQTLIA